ncbi:MAG: AtpZ/AtpI family protein [Rhizobiales bacterium]|nr:AtpZ/AtpI family protein [Hyphomicrobiales bacterium]
MTYKDRDKLKAFDDALKKAKKPKEVVQKSDHNKAMGNAYKYATELFAGFVIGGIMGWSIDKWLETKPLFLIIFIFVGAAAGILNVIKSSTRDYEAQQKAQLDDAKGDKN